MTDEERIEWFNDFIKRIQEEDFRKLVFFLNDLSEKRDVLCKKAYFTGYLDGKAVLVHGTN